MSYPNDAPAAAWYPDPQTSGQVRWWDGQNWTEHVSKPAADTRQAVAELTVAEPTAAAPAVVAPLTVAEQLAAPIVPQVAEADAAFAAADSDAAAHTATVTYIGRHAAGATPAPRQPSTAPRIRPRVRVTLPVAAEVESRVAALAYA